MEPPLALDIDGNLTRPDGGIDERVFEVIRSWSSPVIVTTGKAFPFPIALCQFMHLPERVVAENGGVVAVDGAVTVTASDGRIEACRAALDEAGIDLGWPGADLVNRWRESELAVHPDASRSALASVADRFDLEVVDSGYAYHIKDPAVSKGAGLRTACDHLGIAVADAVAIGDSENDVSTFECVGHAIAVANADTAARAAADEVLPEGFADGTLSALAALRET